jgi:hypothetical protein
MKAAYRKIGSFFIANIKIIPHSCCSHVSLNFLQHNQQNQTNTSSRTNISEAAQGQSNGSAVGQITQHYQNVGKTDIFLKLKPQTLAHSLNCG